MKKTDSKQTLARALIKVAWSGKARVTVKGDSSQKHEPRRNVEFRLTFPGLPQSGETLGHTQTRTWGAYGTTNEVWGSFLEGKLLPEIRKEFIAATVALGKTSELEDDECSEVEAALMILELQSEVISPADIRDPAAHALACALSPRGNWLLGDGGVHPCPPGVHSQEEEN
jgi:hypothetical protein